MLRPESTIPAEPLIGRELIPSTKTPLLGEYVPRSVVIDQFEVQVGRPWERTLDLTVGVFCVF